MWYSENQRLGFRRCTPAGYMIHSLSGLIAASGLLILIAALGVLAYKFLSGSFSWPLLGLLAIGPTGLLLGWAGRKIAWSLARRKGFHYDYERDQCT